MSERVKTTEIPLHWVENDRRLDASYYGQENIEARLAIDKIEEEGVTLTTVGDHIDELFKNSRFKRDYVNKETGDPYLTPTDMFMFPIKPRKYVRNPPDDAHAEPGWVLITRSGTVGRTIIANKPISNYVISDDLVRAVNHDDLPAYLYAYLNSWMGQAFLSKDKFGATVKHIDPHQIAEIPVPIFSEISDEVSKKIRESYNLRESAHLSLKLAENKLDENLKLPEIGPTSVEYYGEEGGKRVKAFELTSDSLNKRLDASYHIPWVHEAIRQMEVSEENGLGTMVKLKDIADAFVPPRFTRVYVDDPEMGIPMLQGSHVDQIVPQGIKYIWKNMDHIEKYVVEEGWILVTCSGTIGDLCLVSDRWDNWAATNHLIRIIPSDSGIHPGYLTAFLQSSYGQVQFDRLIYGGVVDEIGESGELVDDIIIFVPDDGTVEKEIGQMVLQAYSNRDESFELEQRAVELIENRIGEQVQNRAPTGG